MALILLVNDSFLCHKFVIDMEVFNVLLEQGLFHTCTLNKDGKLIDVSTVLSQQLGYSTTALQDMDINEVFTEASLEKIISIFHQTTTDTVVSALELTLIDHLGQFYQVLGNGIINWDRSNPTMYLVLMPLGELGQHLNQLENANQVMSEMLQSTRVAYWCIEWEQPIDLNTATDDILRQVFETSSHWRMCNTAMRDVYEMPKDVIFSQQPVRLYWPRSPANEEFVRHLIQSDFYVNGALSVDRRHDGSLAYVENDVRAHIEQGKMSRMWGSIYDVSQEFDLQQDAEHRIHALKHVFDAVPDAVVVVDENFHPQWRNAAFEQSFGIIKGTQITQILKQSSLIDRAWHHIDLPNLQGKVQDYHVHCSAIHLQKNLLWTVIVLRPAVYQPAEYELYP